MRRHGTLSDALGALGWPRSAARDEKWLLRREIAAEVSKRLNELRLQIPTNPEEVVDFIAPRLEATILKGIRSSREFADAH